MDYYAINKVLQQPDTTDIKLETISVFSKIFNIFCDKSSKSLKGFWVYNFSAIQLAFSKILPKTSANSVSVSLSILLNIYLVNMYIIVIIFYD